jgi:CRISPR-associated protein Cmr5
MNLDLERARDALMNIEVLRSTTISGDYLSYVKSLPATILQNGLGQAMATQLAAAKGKGREDNGHACLYWHMRDWLCRDDDRAPYPREPDLMHGIVNGDQEAYIHAQSEAISYLNWLKKFAVAYLSSEQENPDAT